MEEWVGRAWHALVTRASQREYPDAAVSLEEVRQCVAMLFRALGGDGGLRVEAATETEHGARRSFFSRIAGTNKQVELAWRDEETLRLPMQIACFEQCDLNRELYLWLTAVAALSEKSTGVEHLHWLNDSAGCTAQLLAKYPGLVGRYHRLVAAHIAQRPDPATLPEMEARQESQIRQALLDPTCESSLAETTCNKPFPVIMWLHPNPPVNTEEASSRSVTDDVEQEEGREERTQDLEFEKRRRGERVDEPDSKSGLIAFRLESLFTRTEYVAVDRTQEENEDEDAKSSAEDLDVLSMSQQRNTTGARLRFDLDLPGADYDDIRLGEGIPLPEWDYRHRRMQLDHCRIQPMLARDVSDRSLPEHLKTRARRLRSLFEILKPRRVWRAGQPDGSELDTSALVQQAADRIQGLGTSEANLYRNFRNCERDLSCLVLADFSLSTDAYVGDDQRVIDVIRDSLHLFAEALQGTGDRFSLYGFSSRHRSHVRFHTLKTFDEKHGGEVRGRINAIKPGYYTRMGAAIRYASRLLNAEDSSQKLLLILTDGKPNDLDKYEGRYGVEDTRAAVREASRSGIQPFCVTIDKKAGDYLPYLFGSKGYVLLHNAAQLPAKLPQLYANLTHQG